ncbi:recombinase family protein [Cytobacillus oceanisediminis]|uniref:recombinase family protein n=1 Tax=Cytobacillus TaxID=2675230 RepID=UPI001C228F1F|nr:MULTISPECIES: recombinase family protein [Cytobacillus]MBU8732045.1 recombinase family protein [Cytobacillus oceanisediminis]WHY35394.1 recombinase family protein [Cytobacillus firmus]
MVTNNIIKNVAMYLRISRDKGENVDTLQNHRERLVRLCEDRGYTYTIYEEIVSGQARMEAREALNSLLDELEKYDAVVVTAIDRLSRDLEYSIHIFKRLEKVGIPVITPERIYTEQDFTLYAIESTLAHGEYKQIRKRMLQGKRDKALRGEIVASRPPYGYDSVMVDKKRTFVPNKDADTVKKIFNLAINGYGGKSISDITGKPYKSVQNIIRNEAYTGTMIYKDIRVEDAFTAIVDKDTFKKANQAMKARFAGDREQRTRTKGKVRTILKDLVYCDNCDRKISFQLKRRELYEDAMVTKKCECGMPGVKEETLLAEFYAQFYWVELHFRKEWQKALETPLEDKKGIIEGRLTELTKKQEKLNRRLKNAREMRLDGELSKAEFEEIKAESEKELIALSSKIAELNEELLSLDTTKLSQGYQEKLKLIGMIKEELNLPEGKGQLNYTKIEECTNKEEANRLLKLLIDKIYYFRGIEANAFGEEEEVIKLTIAPR